MKMPHFSQKLLAASLLATALGAVLVVVAEPDREQNPERRPPPRDGAGSGQRPQFTPGGPGRGGPGLGFERLFSVLTEDQRASLREAMDGLREKSRELEEKLRDARKDLFAASLAEKFDEDAVRQKAMAVAKLDAELTVLRAKAFSKMRPALTPEQIEKVKNPPAARGDEPSEPPRRRPEAPRDEHGLPPKK